MAGDRTSCSSTAKRVTTQREPHLEKREAEMERGGPDSATFISLSDPMLQGAVGK